MSSLEIVEDWKRQAGVSLSKIVVERVEDSIRREEGYLSHVELVRRLREAEGELMRLHSVNPNIHIFHRNLIKETI